MLKEKECQRYLVPSLRIIGKYSIYVDFGLRVAPKHVVPSFCTSLSTRGCLPAWDFHSRCLRPSTSFNSQPKGQLLLQGSPPVQHPPALKQTAVSLLAFNVISVFLSNLFSGNNSFRDERQGDPREWRPRFVFVIADFCIILSSYHRGPQTFPDRVIEWKKNALWVLNPGTVLFLCFGCFRAHTHLDSACCVCKGPGGMCFMH